MTKLQLGIASLACITLLPAMALAQEKPGGSSFDIPDTPPTTAATVSSPSQSTSTSEVTLGAGGVSKSSDVFGRYNGMPRAGLGVIGSWDVQHRDAPDGGGTRFFTFTGDQIDFGFGRNAPEASIDLKIGQQGKWWVSGAYDATTYVASDHFTSILNTDGTLTRNYLTAIQNAGAFNPDTVSASGLTPTGGIGANCPPAPIPVIFSNSNPFFTPSIACSAATGKYSYRIAGNALATFGTANESIFDIGTRRDKATIGGGYRIGDWLFTTGLSHEHKEGTLEQAMTTGGSNTGMVAFPMPINYDTDNYTLSAAYTTERLRVILSYELSNFSDNNASGFAFEGWNVVTVAQTTAPTGVGPTLGATTFRSFEMSGVYSLPPSNQAHTISAQIGYDPSPTVRLNGTFVYSLQLQDERFVPATNNAFVLASSTLGPQLASNPSSLRGEVQTFFGNVGLNARPARNLDIKASYTIDDRNPNTNPMSIFGDPTDTTALKLRQAVPESWTKQQIVLTAGYRILKDTKVTLGYTFRDAQRENAITHHSRDNEESAKIQSTFNEGASASLGYVHADRNASAPDFSLWNTQINSDCGSSITGNLGCQQVPFYEAARTQDAVTGLFTNAVGAKGAFSVFAKYVNNKYNGLNAVYNGTVNPSVGINRDYSVQFGPDFTYQLSKDSQFHVFYTFLRTYRTMRALNNQSVVGGGNFFTEATTYDVQTAGFNIERQWSPKLKLGADYTFSYGDVGFAQSGTWANNEAGQTFGGDPSLSTKSTNHQVRLHAFYNYSPNLSLYLAYRFDSLDTTDWALVGASVGQVLTGDVPAKYNVHTVMAALTYKF